METLTKTALCALVLAAATGVVADVRRWRKTPPLRERSIAPQ
jgi:hypothetical protein